MATPPNHQAASAGRPQISRRVRVGLTLGCVALAGCAQDSSRGPTATTTTDAVSSTTVAFDDFEAEDVETLCADLAGLADIDPDADPTQAQVDRLEAIAQTAPSGVADPLRAVAAFGQGVVDGDDDLEALQEQAVEGAVLLIAYGNEACQIDVPLFDTIAGV